MDEASSPLSSLSYSTPKSHISSQPSPFATSIRRSSNTSRIYRTAIALPFELQERCRIFLEEALYVQALTLLQSVVVQGSSSSGLIDSSPAYVPPASHVAFICTLAVHPSMNTRTKNLDKIKASTLSFHYLHLLHDTVGPLQGIFLDAYAFPNSALPSRRALSSRTKADSPEKYVQDAITSDLAGSDSLWSRAGDFWSAVGWAFNCSVAHKRRWAVWQLWLEHVVDVLERDWDSRFEADDAKRSLFLSFSSADNDSRRIVRAIFADGSKKDLQEFREIWKNETREKKEKALDFGKVKIGKIDIDGGDFGDYFEDSSDDESYEELSESDKPDGYQAASSTSTAVGALPDGTLPLGGFAAVSLRMRLFALLSNLSLALPKQFVDIRSLFDLYILQIRPYPLLTFAAVLSPSSMKPLTLAVGSALVQYLARSLLETAAPPPMIDDLSQESLEECYLSWAANTHGVADNAKIGACVEYLVRMFDREVGLKWSESLQKAVDEGIERREEKATRARKKKGEAGTGSNDIDLAWMRASGRRLKILLQILKMH